jgi:2-polyprenyl-6-hydroxyphenyl methylase/3-demethylubiquinone-9 3-methyltransferase
MLELTHLSDPASRSNPAIAYHDDLAMGWSGRYASGGFGKRADFLKREVLPLLALRGRWIDAGCGSGVFSRILADNGADVLGVDGSSAMIEAARAGRGDPAPRYEVRMIESLEREPGGWDGVLCLSVIEYLDDPVAGLAILTRLLRPGGALVLSAPNRHSGLRRAQSALRALASSVGAKAFDYLESSRNTWSRRELVAFADACGLDVEKILGFDPKLPNAAARIFSPSLWVLVGRRRAPKY